MMTVTTHPNPRAKAPSQQPQEHPFDQVVHPDSIGALRETLARIPGGVEAVKLMTRLGLWTTPLHNSPPARRGFPSKFSDLGHDELSDLSARVVSEAGRVVELVGILSGLETQLKIKSRSTRAAARARIRRGWPPDMKNPTKTELDDTAEEDPAVITVDEQMALLGLFLAQASAVKEANTLFKEAVSREITYRSALINARIY